MPQCRCSRCRRAQCRTCSGAGEVLRTVLVGTGLIERWVRCDCPLPTAGLSEVDRQMLEFEQQWWEKPGSKQQAIVTTFDLGLTAYYQRLNALLKLPDALAEYPMVVGRLRRIQQSSWRRRLAW